MALRSVITIEIANAGNPATPAISDTNL
jgi:hypothetical protein